MRASIRIAIAAAVLILASGCVTAAHYECDYVEGLWTCSASGTGTKTP